MKIKKLFCLLGFHTWSYKREKHKVLNHPSGRECVRVPVRECNVCGHREHHIHPKNLGLTNWESFDHIPGDATIKYSEL